MNLRAKVWGSWTTSILHCLVYLVRNSLLSVKSNFNFHKRIHKTVYDVTLQSSHPWLVLTIFKPTICIDAKYMKKKNYLPLMLVIYIYIYILVQLWKYNIPWHNNKSWNASIDSLETRISKANIYCISKMISFILNIYLIGLNCSIPGKNFLTPLVK